MKRLHLYLTEQMIEKLNKMSKETGIPKAEIVRRAVSDYLKKSAK